jgi:hypothetical protein
LFEAILFLKKNRSLWDEYTVGKALGKTYTENFEDDDLFYEV